MYDVCQHTPFIYYQTKNYGLNASSDNNDITVSFQEYYILNVQCEHSVKG